MEVLGSHRADNTNGADDYAKFRWSLCLGPNQGNGTEIECLTAGQQATWKEVFHCQVHLACRPAGCVAQVSLEDDAQIDITHAEALWSVMTRH